MQKARQLTLFECSHSSRSEQRLNDLAVLSIERDFSSQLSLERVVDKFADLDKNRRIVLS